jgi:flavin reductase (DIM6/NTAB) family NADH-FMN oxidoreductase RutF
MEKIRLGPQTFIYPMPAVLVGATINGKPNFMTAAWCAIAAFKPPAVSVAIRKVRYTLKGVREHGNFSVNVASSSLVKKVDYCGIYSGKSTDKSQIFTVFYGELKTAPLIEECPVNLECKTLHYLDLGSHTLVVGEIIETFITEGYLVDGKGDPETIDPLIFIPGTSKYHRLGEEIAPAFQIGKKLPNS